MATTYVLISSQVLGSNAASVTFSSIPQTYTDLYLMFSARTVRSGTTLDMLRVTFNSDTTAGNYSALRLASDATGAGLSAVGNLLAGYANAATSTTNAFSSGELYIPSYTNSSATKPYSGYSVCETNLASPVYMAAFADLWQGTAAISQLIITSDNAQNILAGSSFYLYGIKNS